MLEGGSPHHPCDLQEELMVLLLSSLSLPVLIQGCPQPWGRVSVDAGTGLHLLAVGEARIFLN